MSVLSEYAISIGSIGWIVAVLALFLKTYWKSGTDSCRRLLSFIYDLFVLTFVSITFVVALTIKFPDLTIVENTLNDLVKNGNKLQEQNKKIIEGFTYTSENTRDQLTILCHQYINKDPDNFPLPDVIQSQLGLNDTIREFTITFDHLNVSCWPNSEQFLCGCQGL